jgi:hypothetical protein
VAELLTQRMRIRKGRVMHKVKRWNSNGRSEPELESQCRRGSGIKGVSATYPRAQGPESWWTTERYWYPDCARCPADEEPPRR